MSDPALIRVTSHRARSRVKALVGEENMKMVGGVYKFEAYEIPAEYADAALAFPSVGRARLPKPPRTWIDVDDVKVGETILAGPDRSPCKVLSIEHGTETVFPLAGRPCIRLWCREVATDREGNITFGPGASVRVV